MKEVTRVTWNRRDQRMFNPLAKFAPGEGLVYRGREFTATIEGPGSAAESRRQKHGDHGHDQKRDHCFKQSHTGLRIARVHVRRLATMVVIRWRESGRSSCQTVTVTS